MLNKPRKMPWYGWLLMPVYMPLIVLYLIALAFAPEPRCERKRDWRHNPINGIWP